MRLLYSDASPYARKVRAWAIALGIDSRIALVPVDPSQPSEVLLAANPLGRVPTLITAEGFAIFDSAVICDYLNGVSELISVIPLAGAARWLSLRLEALGDGVMDAAVTLRQVQSAGVVAEDHRLVQRHRGAITRTLDHLEKTVPAQHVDIGTVSIACALGYLDFRFAPMNWRGAHPRLAAWHATFAEAPCLVRTVPNQA